MLVASLLLLGLFTSTSVSAQPLSSAVSTSSTPQLASQDSASASLARAARLAWGDVDGDGLADVYAIGRDGEDRLFRNLGDGRFADITVQAGVAGSTGSVEVRFADYDGDEALDLYLSSGYGQGRLLRNLGGGRFEDATNPAGIEHSGPEQSAQWLDYDHDGRQDLQVVTVLRDVLYHNRGDGTLERIEFTLPPGNHGEAVVEIAAGSVSHRTENTDPAVDRAPDAPSAESDRTTRTPVPPGSDRPGRGAGDAVVDLTPRAGGTIEAQAGIQVQCARSVSDQASPGTCLQASSTPSLGKLYPLSTALNVDGSGRVGVGTSTPGASLHVRESSAGAPAISTVPKVLIEASDTLLGNNLEFLSPPTTQQNIRFNTSGGGGGSIGLINYRGSSGILRLSASGGPGLLVNSAGNVGVGILGGLGETVPEARLHVFEGSAGTVTAHADASAVFERDNANYLHILAPDASERGILLGDPSISDRFGIVCDGNALEFRNGPNTRMIIDSLGAVGIGTEVPETSFHVSMGATPTTATIGDMTALFERPTGNNAVVLRGSDASLQSIYFDGSSAGSGSVGSIGYQGTSGNLGLSAGNTLTVDLNAAPRLKIDATGKVGIGTTAPSAGLHVESDAGVLATGTFGVGSIPAEGPGTRMMWYPRKAAFRVGAIGSTGWNDAFVGDYSFAAGSDAEASGDYSTALGDTTTAAGASSTALGFSTQANGESSAAIGRTTVANGFASISMGEATTAGGSQSVAMGLATSADSSVSTAIGRYNVGGGDPLNWVATDPLFEVGIGTGLGDRSNAVTILKSGNVGISTTNPRNPLHIAAAGTDSGGILGSPQVVARLRQSTSGQASAIAIDALGGQDSILYLSEAGAAVWDLRNKSASSDDLTIN
ncbi:MAG: FG-GAP-like repeat-containing protein, partial [Planctomycetota bacterium]